MNTRRYLDVIDDIVHSYNNTYHRSIGMAPSQVDADNEDDVRKRLYPPKPKKFVWKLNVGDTVRISVRRRVFRKAYVGNWSEGGALNLQDRKMTDKEISRGGNCRTGK